MSVFQVQLQNNSQGGLDTSLNGASVQRTLYVMGPKRINRILNDGDTFTDCNYWKRFAYPQLCLEDAFIKVILDDGSIYSDYYENNNFPYVFNVLATAGSTYSQNQINLTTVLGGPALFTQITNMDSTPVKMRLNGSGNAIMDLPQNSTQVFNNNELSVTMLEFDNSMSGASDVTIQIVAAGLSVPQS